MTHGSPCSPPCLGIGALSKCSIGTNRAPSRNTPRFAHNSGKHDHTKQLTVCAEGWGLRYNSLLVSALAMDTTLTDGQLDQLTMSHYRGVGASNWTGADLWNVQRCLPDFHPPGA